MDSGHLHLTVGTAVTLTFMGITYWLVPTLCGRALWGRRVALVQVWLWFIGMAIFSHAMHQLGMLGAPRRTMLGAAAYVQPEWKPLLPLVGLGGSAPLRQLPALLPQHDPHGDGLATRPAAGSRIRRHGVRTRITPPRSWIAGSLGSRRPSSSS